MQFRHRDSCLSDANNAASFSWLIAVDSLSFIFSISTGCWLESALQNGAFTTLRSIQALSWPVMLVTILARLKQSLVPKSIHYTLVL